MESIMARPLGLTRYAVFVFILLFLSACLPEPASGHYLTVHYPIVARQQLQRQRQRLAQQQAPKIPVTHNVCLMDSQCLNGGSCHASPEGNFNCSCQDGYTGERCESYCPLQCQNSGICQVQWLDSETPSLEAQQQSRHNNNFACRCFGRFSGDRCEIPYENCQDGSRCYHGGKCHSEHDGELQEISCDCPAGYYGSECTLVEEEPASVSSTAASDMLRFRGKGTTWVVLLLSVLLLAAGGTLVAESPWRKRRSKKQDGAEMAEGSSQNDDAHPPLPLLPRRTMSEPTTEKIWMNIV